MNHIIDLRSDTVTKPTAAMLAAMLAAEVGDDVYGEDPTVNALEAKVAGILGKEAAMFVPTGTMANQIALNLHCRPGESVIIEADSHCYLYEAGAAAALSGIQFDQIPWSEDYSDAAIQRCWKADTLHYPTTRLLVVENSHNRRSGLPRDMTTVRRITAKAKSLGLVTHCDGARIWNTAVATQQSERELVESFDTIAVCFSKGLGAPVGSALAGTKDHIARARKIRKRLGGGMRQAGYLAAAAIYSLNHHRQRLGDDHRRAKVMAEGLREIGAGVNVPEMITNMVYFKTKLDGDQLVRQLRETGILLNHLGGGWIRAVTHLHIGDSDVQYFLDKCILRLQ